MASKRYNDLISLQKCKGKVVPRGNSKAKYKKRSAARAAMKERIKRRDDLSRLDTSRPSGDSYYNNVWGF